MDVETFKFNLLAEKSRYEQTFIKMNGESVRPRNIPCINCERSFPVNHYAAYLEDDVFSVPTGDNYVRWVAPYVHILPMCDECLLKEWGEPLNAVPSLPAAISWHPPNSAFWC